MSLLREISVCEWVFLSFYILCVLYIVIFYMSLFMYGYWIGVSSEAQQTGKPTLTKTQILTLQENVNKDVHASVFCLQALSWRWAYKCLGWWNRFLFWGWFCSSILKQQAEYAQKNLTGISVCFVFCFMLHMYIMCVGMCTYTVMCCITSDQAMSDSIYVSQVCYFL